MARVLRASKNCTASLSDYYLGLDPKTIPLDRKAPIPPHFQRFTVGEIAYKLTYTDRMAGKQSHKALFVASVRPENDAGNLGSAIVKSTKLYCQDAHKILVEASPAPGLRYCEKVESIGMYLVVMDIIVGEYPEAPRKDRDFTEKLRMAIETLHAKGFVHGDLREPNVLVTKEGDVKIIDFDWSGRHAIPPTSTSAMVSSGIQGWSVGVQSRRSMIRKCSSTSLARGEGPNLERFLPRQNAASTSLGAILV